ncbi:MAG: helix-hairpin-helix domain-containing protein [Elusimicrobia bacterium]|nr:helix-hairpin-helix domain-containing protein [Elusimicrobiota bacterium]
MYKEGININTVSIEKLKTLPGIGDNLARSILLHRELKSEFVNPEELKSILPEKVFSAISNDYNVYAVSPVVWKTRITTDPLKLYDRDFEIHFGPSGVIAVRKKSEVSLVGFSNEESFFRALAKMVSARGFVFAVRKFFGWKIPVKALFLVEIPDYDELEKFLCRVEVSAIYSVSAEDFVKSSGVFRNVSRKILEGTVREFSPIQKISNGIFELHAIYPPHNSENSLRFAFLLTYGAIKGLFMYNMGVSDQKNLVHSKFAEDIKDVKFVFSPDVDVIPILRNFCSDPLIVDAKKNSVLVSDGNLIYPAFSVR